MDKVPNFGINGGPRLPIGYRFRPTDQELVVHYLQRKALSLPLPSSAIPEFDVFQIPPFALPGDVKEKRYFFYKKEKGEHSSIIDVMVHKRYCSSGSGYWKPVGKGRVILASDHSNQPVGLRRTMAFCGGKRNRDANTRWLLHEYHLVRSGPTPNSLHQVFPMEANEYWVVCGVFQKKRRFNKKDVSAISNEVCVVDFEVEDVSSSGPTTPTTSCSSGIASDDVDDNQDLNSVVHISCCIREP